MYKPRSSSGRRHASAIALTPASPVNTGSPPEYSDKAARAKQSNASATPKPRSVARVGWRSSRTRLSLCSSMLLVGRDGGVLTQVLGLLLAKQERVFHDQHIHF